MSGRSLMEALQDEYGVEVLHGWGMTETSPVATISKPLRKHMTSSRAERRSRQVKQGRAVFGVEIGIRDGNNRELPHDGKAVGDLLIRGPWIARCLLQDAGKRAGRRLVFHGRCRDDRQRRLYADYGPLEGRHQVRRRMDISLSNSKTSRWPIPKSPKRR